MNLVTPSQTPPLAISNSFNDYFATVAKNVAKKILIPRAKKRHLDDMKNRISNTIFLTPTTPIEILDIINNFENNKSLGPNSKPINLLKMLGPHMSDQLSIMNK